MALLTKRSKCALCREPIGAEPVKGFRHFVRNRKDPLYILTDAAVHQRCFQAWPLRERALARIKEREHRMQNRVCLACGQPITEDWYWTDYLTDDLCHPLHEFNYLHFHRRHLALWPDLQRFRELLAEFVRLGEYEGPPILPQGAL